MICTGCLKPGVETQPLFSAFINSCPSHVVCALPVPVILSEYLLAMFLYLLSQSAVAHVHNLNFNLHVSADDVSISQTIELYIFSGLMGVDSEMVIRGRVICGVMFLIQPAIDPS